MLLYIYIIFCANFCVKCSNCDCWQFVLPYIVCLCCRCCIH